MNDSRNRDDETPSWLSSYLALWRSVPGSLAYLIGGFVLSMVAISVLSSVFFSGVGMVILVIGVPIIVGSLFAARGFGMADRALMTLTGLPEIAEPTWPAAAPEASTLTKLVAPMKSGHYWSYLLHHDDRRPDPRDHDVLGRDHLGRDHARRPDVLAVGVGAAEQGRPPWGTGSRAGSASPAARTSSRPSSTSSSASSPA